MLCYPYATATLCNALPGNRFSKLITNTRFITTTPIKDEATFSSFDKICTDALTITTEERRRIEDIFLYHNLKKGVSCLFTDTPF